ncbi:uncharacterized protein LOC125051850 [Pieris napi]|uniref:uncharacterized protein LOC125051850 n=1 Tax=Pieris napi TaxID=78633 RepID=UPI001FBB5E63|nr:uncharacterized protein LOC125051850 [Pieris napi]
MYLNKLTLNTLSLCSCPYRMRLLLILISSLLVMCIAEVQKKNRNEPPTETLSEKRILMPPRHINIKLSPKTKPQPLISLYKTYVGKKSLMRKFVPVPRMTEPPIKVTRRPVMKQRQLVVGSVTVKPHKKEDIHVTLRRKANFRPVSFVKDTKRQEVAAKSVKPDSKEDKHVTKALANDHKEDILKPKEEKIDADEDNKEFIFLNPNASAAKEDSDKNSN